MTSVATFAHFFITINGHRLVALWVAAGLIGLGMAHFIEIAAGRIAFNLVASFRNHILIQVLGLITSTIRVIPGFWIYRSSIRLHAIGSLGSLLLFIGRLILLIFHGVESFG